MKNYKWLIWLIMMIGTCLQPCLAQEPPKVYSQKKLDLLSDDLARYIHSKEERYLTGFHRGSEGIESGFINQTYQSEKYFIVIDINLYKSEAAAAEEFKQAFYGSNAAVGMRLAEIGDKAHGWFNGTIYVRKGNVLAFIYVRPRDQDTQSQQTQNKDSQPGQTTEANQSDEEPVNRNPNSSTRLEIAKRFARHIVGFFEEQSAWNQLQPSGKGQESRLQAVPVPFNPNFEFQTRLKAEL
ncbi:MAG: hypothetical protein HY774_25295 [Acidobacteria bacterium]|nr:hypothetical protein [Acidobacteriota bacterium]